MDLGLNLHVALAKAEPSISKLPRWAWPGLCHSGRHGRHTAYPGTASLCVPPAPCLVRRSTATVAILELPHFRTRGGAFSFCTGPCQLYNWSYFTFGCLHLPFSIIIIIFFWPRPWHAEVPEPGTKPDLNHGSSDDARSLTPGLPGNSLFSYLLNFKGSHFSKLKNSIPHRIKTNTDIYYLFCTFRRALMSTVVHKLQYTPHMANP